MLNAYHIILIIAIITISCSARVLPPIVYDCLLLYPCQASDILEIVTAGGLATRIKRIFYALPEISFLLLPLLPLTHPTMPGPFTAWQI
jgi:hypothetical protein